MVRRDLETVLAMQISAGDRAKEACRICRRVKQITWKTSNHQRTELFDAKLSFAVRKVSFIHCDQYALRTRSDVGASHVLYDNL